MAGVKISNLPVSTAAADDDIFVVVDISDGTDGTTKQIAFSQLQGQIDSVVSASESLISDKVAVSSTSANVNSFVHFGDLSTGYDDVQVNSSLFYNPSTGTLNATAYAGDGSQLTGLAASSVDSAYVQNIVDLSALWDSINDGSRNVYRAQNSLYIDATAGGTGLQTYIQGGPQDDIDLVASGGNAFTGLTTNQPWTSILAFGPDFEQYTSALLGLNATGMHTRYGHMRISEDSVNIVADNSQTVAITAGTTTLSGDLTTAQTSTATNFREGVREEDSVAVTLSPSLGQMVKHTPAVGTGNLTYLYDAGWQTGESLTLHLFTDSDRAVTWPTTLWVDSAFDSAFATTGAHLVNVWKLDETNFFAAYVGEAK